MARTILRVRAGRRPRTAGCDPCTGQRLLCTGDKIFRLPERVCQYRLNAESASRCFTEGFRKAVTRSRTEAYQIRIRKVRVESEEP